jgi:hypothetical protein
MTFTVNCRLATTASTGEVVTALENQFKKISEQIERKGDVLAVTNLKYESFLTFPATTTANVSLKKAVDGWLLTADCDYAFRPALLVVSGVLILAIYQVSGFGSFIAFSLTMLGVARMYTLTRLIKELVGESFNLVSNELSTGNRATDERICPFCAETIKAAATICRYCKNELPPLAIVAPSPVPESESQATDLPGKNWTPQLEMLANAIIRNDVARVKALVAQGVEINTKNENGVTPIQMAMNCENAEIVDILSKAIAGD